MIALSVIPDRFKEQEKELLGSAFNGQRPTKPHIRRPTRGISLKEETFSTLRVVAGDGTSLLLVDAGSNRGPSDKTIYEVNGKRATDVYSNFFLQQINEERQEKSQILETFGDPYIFLFGERARIVTFQGILLNTFDFNWEAEWWHNYENYLRGTRCVQNDARVFLSFDETLVTGYILGCAASKDTNNKNFVNFQFQLFVTSYSNFSKIGDPHALGGVTFDQQGKWDFSLSEELAAQYRPGLIDPSSASRGAQNASVGLDGKIAMPTLVEGFLRQGLTPVIKTFNTAQQIANTALKKLSNLVAGEVIRVPVGFEGSLAFDDGNDAELRNIDHSGKVTYTVFSENTDEYVGVGTQYGSSRIGTGFEMEKLRLDPTTEEEQEEISKTLDKAQTVWREAGLEVPDNQLGPISAFIAGKGVGLIAVGATEAWRIAKPSGAPDLLIRGLITG